MNFLFPSFLYALFAVLIPVLIHLFSFRLHKEVYYSDIRFLQNIKQETKSKTQLKNLLILLMRILAVAALVIAFAQPYKSTNQNHTQKPVNKVGIYIDNSFSTEAEGKYGKLSELAKNKALAVLNAYPPDTKFLYLTNEFKSKHLHLLSAEQVKDFIAETQIAPQSRQQGEVLKKMSDFFDETRDSSDRFALYMISDLQKSTSRPDAFPEDIKADVYFLPLEAELRNNILIDSVWFENPGHPINQPDEIYVSITNKSDEDFTDIPVNLFLNDSLKSPGSINLNAGERKTYKLTFTNTQTGNISGRAEITDYPITFDNRFYFSFNIPKQKNIRIISNQKNNKFISSIYAGEKLFNLSENIESAINISEINEQDVIILDGLNSLSDGLNTELINFVSEGGILIVFPAFNANFESYNNFFTKIGTNYITQKDTTQMFISHINYKANVLRGIFLKQDENPDLPVLRKRLQFSSLSKTHEEGILYTESNEKALFTTKYGSGQVYVYAQPANPEAGNFVYHPLWAPLLYNMALFGTDESRIYYTIGARETVKIKAVRKNAEDLIKIKLPGSETEFIPPVSQTQGGVLKLFPSENIQTAGSYSVYLGEKYLRDLSYNYDRTESDIEAYSVNEWQKITDEILGKHYHIFTEKTDLLSAGIKNKQKGIHLWKYFVIAALFFLLVEILIIRFYKKEN